MILLTIIVAFLGCDTKQTGNCNLKEFLFFNNSIVIKLPNVLFERIDTLDHDFEKNERRLLISELSTKDSSSYVSIIVEQFKNQSFYGEDVVRNIKRIKNVQKSMINIDKDGFVMERYDTVGGSLSGQFVFEGTEQGKNVTTGAITFYHNNARVEIIVVIDEYNFTDSKEKVVCILSSVQPRLLSKVFSSPESSSQPLLTRSAKSLTSQLYAYGL